MRARLRPQSSSSGTSRPPRTCPTALMENVVMLGPPIVLIWWFEWLAWSATCSTSDFCRTSPGASYAVRSIPSAITCDGSMCTELHQWRTAPWKHVEARLGQGPERQLSIETHGKPDRADVQNWAV